MIRNTCCFIGHKTIKETQALKEKLYDSILGLIDNEKVDTFFFGSKSRFNDLCYETVSALREEYPNVKRIYVRAEYPDIDIRYKEYLLKNYEATYFPEKIRGAGRAVYVERNYEMINNSEYCFFYYQKQYVQKSGTEIAYNYARKLNKKIINITDNLP